MITPFSVVKARMAFVRRCIGITESRLTGLIVVTEPANTKLGLAPVVTAKSIVRAVTVVVATEAGKQKNGREGGGRG